MELPENVKFDSIREFVRVKVRQESEEHCGKVDGVYFKRANNSLVEILKKEEFQASVEFIN